MSETENRPDVGGKGRRVDLGQIGWALVVIIPVAALLLRPDSGFRLLFRSTEGFPATPGAWWGSLLGLVIGVGLLVVGYLASEALKQEHQAYVDRLAKERQAEIERKAEEAMSPQQKRAREYISRDYKEVRDLVLSPSVDAGRAAGQPGPPVTAKLFVATKDEANNPPNSWTKRGGIAYADGRHTDFVVTVMFDELSWRKLDNQKVESKFGGAPMPIDQVLSGSMIASTASDAKYVVCFGMASHEEGSNHAQNDRLAEQRAFNLCRAVKNLELMKRTTAKAIGISIGQAISETSNPDIALRQRAAVVVAVTETFLDLRAQDIAIAAGNLIEVRDVDLRQYERFERGYHIMQDVTKGKYVGLDYEFKWDDMEPDEVIIHASPMPATPTEKDNR